jgi:UDP-N-acetylglucosamine acyltransferase
MATTIHKTAIVSKKAELGDNVFIGPFCIVGDGAKLGKGVKIISHAVIDGEVEIGEDCVIHQFATIGLPPQDLKYKEEKTQVIIGKKNIIREYVSIHRASVSGHGVTKVGDSNFIMAYVHIAHDCIIGSSNILANASTFAGHVMIEDFAFIGGLVAVHQFNRIGSYAMVGGCTGIVQDIPPYVMASDHRAKLYGLNLIGLKRRGFSDETINTLKAAYRILFREKATMTEALKRVKSELPQIPEILHLVEFIESNKRGICR